MKRMHDCERTRFADVEADARLQAAVEAGRCGRHRELFFRLIPAD
jgi:hypothetical protein